MPGEPGRKEAITMVVGNTMKKNIILILLCCSLLIVCCSSSFSAMLFDRVVATVNDEVITWSELMNSIEFETREALQELDEGDRGKKIRELESLFLHNMISLRLQVQEAHRTGLRVKSSETDGAIADIRKKYNLTEETFIKSLKTEGLTLDDYKKQLSEQILISKAVKFEVRDNVLIPDKEIEEYYAAHKDSYRRDEKIRIRQIFFLIPQNEEEKPGIEDKARKILQRIDRGEDFAKLAGEFSEDSTKKFGGDLGYVSRGSVLKEIEEVAFHLQTGEVSSPFWSSAGLHIVKLEEKIEGSGIQDVRNEIKDILFEKAFKSKYEAWIKGLREKAYIEVKL